MKQNTVIIWSSIVEKETGNVSGQRPCIWAKELSVAFGAREAWMDDTFSETSEAIWFECLVGWLEGLDFAAANYRYLSAFHCENVLYSNLHIVQWGNTKDAVGKLAL